MSENLKCEKHKNKKNPCHFVSISKVKKNRKIIWKILNEIIKYLKDNGYKGFSAMPVGSTKRKMVYRRNDKNEYDHDIQLLFNSSKKPLKDLINQKVSISNFKIDIIDKIKKYLDNNNKKNCYIIENSKSVITLRIFKDKDKNEWDSSYDLPIIDAFNEIILIRDKNDTYIWNELKNVNESYKKFSNASSNEKLEIRKKYLNKKCEDYAKKPEEQKKSSSLFIEAVNERFNVID